MTAVGQVSRRNAYCRFISSSRPYLAPTDSPLVRAESLGPRLAKRNGMKKAQFAVAWKLAVSLHSISIDGKDTLT